MSLRGAVSIARRLQDPLAELVKIEPKSIGVGQYQHDVDQYRLGRSLDAVVEDAVNAVGVDLNTASALAAGARLRPRRIARRSDRRASRRERPVREPQGAAEGAAARRPHLRAMRRLPAHPERQGAARCLLGASGSLWRGEEDRRRLRPRPALADGRQRRAEGARSARLRRRAVRPADGARTSSPNWKSPAATRARASRPRPSPTASTTSRT